MNAAALRIETPAAEAEAIASICAHELASPRWSESARGDLREIRYSALGVIDHCAGHEGFEDAQAELDRRVSDWADEVDYRTFPRLTDAEPDAHSRDQRKFARESRA